MIHLSALYYINHVLLHIDKIIGHRFRMSFVKLKGYLLEQQCFIWKKEVNKSKDSCHMKTSDVNSSCSWHDSKFQIQEYLHSMQKAEMCRSIFTTKWRSLFCSIMTATFYWFFFFQIKRGLNWDWPMDCNLYNCQ